MKDMDKKLMDVLYIKYNEKIGVVGENEREVVSHILGTDLTLVFNKLEQKTYVLVPLTKAHTFKYHPSMDGNDWLEVDGKAVMSNNYFQKDACQWIEVKTEEILSEVA